jgi:hypothetical protein
MKAMTYAAFAAVIAFASLAAAKADVLYDNGPANGTLGAVNISGFGVSNSFTLPSASIVTGVDFAAELFTGETMSSISWGIVTTPATYTAPNSSPVSGTIVCSSCIFGFLDLYQNSFSTGSVSLAAGTYYLVLTGASTSGGDTGFWDQNNGPSTASQQSVGPIQSESFQIIGATAPVPEPSTWALALFGFVGLGSARFVRRWLHACVQAAPDMSVAAE